MNRVVAALIGMFLANDLRATVVNSTWGCPYSLNVSITCNSVGERLVAIGDEEFCIVSNNICQDDNDGGDCPDAQPRLIYESYCGSLGAGRFGCKPRASCESIQPFPTEALQNESSDKNSSSSLIEVFPSTPTPTPMCEAIDTTTPPASMCRELTTDGWQAISVYERDVYCAKAITEAGFCSGVLPTGACPRAQRGLAEGSVCGRIPNTNVYGCLPRVDCIIKS